MLNANLTLEPAPLPRKGQPDQRTEGEKAARLRWLCRAVLCANDRDILGHILEYIPLLFFRYRLLRLLGSPFGYVRLLLHEGSNITHNYRFIEFLEGYFPALDGIINASSQQVRHFLWRRAQLKAAIFSSKHEFVIGNILDAFFNGYMRIRQTCSGCLRPINKSLEDILGNHVHRTCRTCTSLWLDWSEGFKSQAELDKLGLGILPDMEPSLNLKLVLQHAALQRELPPYYRSDVVSQLAPLVQAEMSLQDLSSAVSSDSQQVIWRNYCEYMLRQLKLRLEPTNQKTDNISQEVDSFYRRHGAIDVLELGRSANAHLSNLLHNHLAKDEACSKLVKMVQGGGQGLLDGVSAAEIRGIFERLEKHVNYNSEPVVMAIETLKSFDHGELIVTLVEIIDKSRQQGLDTYTTLYKCWSDGLSRAIAVQFANLKSYMAGCMWEVWYTAIVSNIDGPIDSQMTYFLDPTLLSTGTRIFGQDGLSDVEKALSILHLGTAQYAAQLMQTPVFQTVQCAVLRDYIPIFSIQDLGKGPVPSWIPRCPYGILLVDAKTLIPADVIASARINAAVIICPREQRTVYQWQALVPGSCVTFDGGFLG